MTSDQDTKVVAEPQVQQVQEAKESAHLVSWQPCPHITGSTGFFTLTKMCTMCQLFPASFKSCDWLCHHQEFPEADHCQKITTIDCCQFLSLLYSIIAA